MRYRLELKLITVMMSIVLMVSNNLNCFAAGKTIEAFKNNNYKGTSDCEEMINGVKGQDSSYTSAFKGPNNSISLSDFTGKTKAIKYWASHGSNAGKLWGNSKVSIDIMRINNFTWSGSNLEFVFLAACNQLDGANKNPRAKYAKAMLGNNAVRVICGYHESAPQAGAHHDAAVVRNFIAKAKTGESVKSSWILANQIYGSSNYCVLTHSGNVQYSRFEGFPGTTYNRPGVRSKSILRFSSANQGGTQQLFSSLRTSIQNMDIPDYSLKAMDKNITINPDTETTVLKLDNYITTQNGEISDKEISISEQQAIQLAQNWIDNIYLGVDLSDFNNAEFSINPIVMAEVDLDGNVDNEVETCVAYDISFKGTYNGIPIEGEKYCAVVDSSGIISSAVCHRDYEMVEIMLPQSHRL